MREERGRGQAARVCGAAWWKRRPVPWRASGDRAELGTERARARARARARERERERERERVVRQTVCGGRRQHGRGHQVGLMLRITYTDICRRDKTD